MVNGSGNPWASIDELRRQAEHNSVKIGVLESRMDAVNTSIKASEQRLENHIDDVVQVFSDRLDRTRNTALVLIGIAVPVVSALIGALIQAGTT